MYNYGILPLIGFALIFTGALIVFVYYAMAPASGNAGKTQSSNQSIQAGGVIFIGPVPIVFGTSQGIAMMALVIGTVMFILAIVALYVLPRLL
ncbi:MAG: DUF131 domain-containing protein [Candidatus Marsarchaeota archaeon]|nr:DUF131 domain-containing protein [Candidatus Marsarchaeota archaeon]